MPDLMNEPELSASTSKRTASEEVRSINLALQGGGTHGAFTWGVLDRLLEEPRLAFEGISATSAGAMNAVVVGFGLSQGGKDGGRRALAQFWRHMSHLDPRPLPPPFNELMGNLQVQWSPAYLAVDLMTQMASPYQFNPLNLNPVRGILERLVDFDVLRSAHCPVRLFLSTVNVDSGQLHILKNEDIRLDAVMAAACSPTLFQAVDLDDAPHWDAGYVGTPALFPITFDCAATDLLVVHSAPGIPSGRPTSRAAILRRTSELAFSAALMRELKAIAFVNSLIERGELRSATIKRVHLHEIVAHDPRSSCDPGAPLVGDWTDLCRRRDIGRDAADRWVKAHLDDLGSQSTMMITGAPSLDMPTTGGTVLQT